MWILGNRCCSSSGPGLRPVAELGNLWPGQAVSISGPYRTMTRPRVLRRVPVLDPGHPQRRERAGDGPELPLLAFHAQLGLTLTIILQLVILWVAIGCALLQADRTQRIMNIAFIVYGVLTAVILIVGVSVAIGHGGSATPFQPWRRTIPNFATGGFLFGTVLLYLVGVEPPFNMGGEFLSVGGAPPG